MADSISVFSASGQVYSGVCQLAGMIITYSGASEGGGMATFTDNIGAGGTKVVEVIATLYSPVIVFFRDSFIPTFSTGMYLTFSSAGMSATLWIRQL
jgi:hypothetical protein